VEPGPRLRPVKRLGQNFLKDPSIASRIVYSANLTTQDTVLEPGSGYGYLTRMLLNYAGHVIAVEKDPSLAAQLRRTFAGRSSLEIVEGDILKTRLPPFNKVVGTPPYYISSKLILFLIKSHFESAHIVLQREFGHRLTAPPGTRDYGRLSVSAQRKLETQTLMDIPRTAFNPRPKVDSVLIAMKPRIPTSEVDNEAFDELVRGVFTQRRRLFRGALIHFLKLRLGTTNARALVKELELPDLRVYEFSVRQLEDVATQLTTRIKLSDWIPKSKEQQYIAERRTRSRA
jgi:16S rRNA (adenine1518-N6/adenine1519-N6)-dimethyltransferase